MYFQHFFEGVKARVAQGVKEEEISFQLAYSKQELRKVIERYPGKEVKRALETLYRKIHKYLSPEENLFPVTAVRSVYDVTTFWGGIQGYKAVFSGDALVPYYCRALP